MMSFEAVQFVHPQFSQKNHFSSSSGRVFNKIKNDLLFLIYVVVFVQLERHTCSAE